MTAALRVAFVSLLASSVLASAAFAQTGNPAGRAYQLQQAQLQTRPGRLGQLALPRGPRFIVEAVKFKAVDESGWTDITNDEVFAIFDNGQQVMATQIWENVDTGEEVQFPLHQRCIMPAVDQDGARNGRWACAPEGVQGPFGFTVTLYERDPDLSYPWGAGFCVPVGPPSDIFSGSASCDVDNSNVLFQHYYSYDVSDILAHLDPGCRCVEEMVRNRRNDAIYEFTLRITRVDTPPVFDRGPIFEAVQVHRSGTLTAPRNQYFDFDTGAIVAGNGDFQFLGSILVHILRPGGGARIWPGGASARGQAACAAGGANYTTNPVNVPPVGSYACYITSDGRVGEFRVDNLVVNTSLTLTYTTWP